MNFGSDKANDQNTFLLRTERMKKKKINQTENPNTLLVFVCRKKADWNEKETKGKAKCIRDIEIVPQQHLSRINSLMHIILCKNCILHFIVSDAIDGPVVLDIVQQNQIKGKGFLKCIRRRYYSMWKYISIPFVICLTIWNAGENFLRKVYTRKLKLIAQYYNKTPCKIDSFWFLREL